VEHATPNDRGNGSALEHLSPERRTVSLQTDDAGTAIALPGDEALARSRTLPYQWDAAIGRMMASAPLTIRIDLDSAP
jgi:hypothetical protein